MEALKGSLEVLKEFFLEILGFLLPGICLIEGFYFISTDSQQVFFNKFASSDKFGYILIVMGYAIGYFVYGIGQITFLHSNFITDTLKIEKEIESSYIFKSVHKNLEKRLNEPVDSKLRSVRSLSMSYLQEYDKKIYNFTFRAELCHSLSIISIILGIFGLMASAINLKFSFPIRNDCNYIFFYFFLLICSFFFQKARMRFYDISLKLIFPIYASKFISSDNSNG